MSVNPNVRSGFNPDEILESKELPDESGSDDTPLYNGDSRDIPIPDSLATDLVSSNPDTLPEKARYALYFSPYNSDFTQEVIAELINRGKHALANQLSGCSNWFKINDCLDCGEKSHSPQTCGYTDICPDCATNHGGRAQAEYGEQVRSWARHSYLCLKLPYDYNDPSDARKAIRDQLRRFFDRTVPLKTSDRMYKEIRSWDTEFGKYLKSEYIDNGRSVPVSELITGYIAGRHSIHQDNGKWKIHIDMLANTRFWDRDKLAEVWGYDDVWSQRITNTDGFRTNTAIMKTLAYVTDKIDCDDAEALVDYHESTKNERRSIVGGSLHGNSPDTAESSDTEQVEQRCPHCGSTALCIDGFTSSIPEGSKETELFIDDEQVTKGPKFSKLIPSD